jgi:hypothetical protein
MRRLTDEQNSRSTGCSPAICRTGKLPTTGSSVMRNAHRVSIWSCWIDQIAWLDELGDFSLAVAGIPASKLRSLTNQAMALDASAIRNDTLPEKRYTSIVALLNRMRVRARGEARFRTIE